MNSNCTWLSILVFLVTLFFLPLTELSSQRLVLEKLYSPVNTIEYDEIAPFVSEDGASLYFTRVGAETFNKALVENGVNLHEELDSAAYEMRLRQIYGQIAGKAIEKPQESNYNQDIWVAYSYRSEFDRLHHPPSPLNNALPNSVSAVYPNGHELIVVNQFSEKGGMRKGFSKIRQKEDGSWTFPQPISINNYHNSGPDVNMALSADGHTMVLALEREDSYGKTDLYVCFKSATGQWSEPRNLGPSVNSVYRETTPALSPDGKILFYASDRDQSSGGADIFIQQRIGPSWARWEAPKRFGYPINSSYNDSHPHFNPATGYLYFCSNRNGTMDIFRTRIQDPAAKIQRVQGIVLDKELMTPVSGNVRVKGKNGHYRFFETASDGTFTLHFSQENDIELLAFVEGYTGESQQASFKSLGSERIQLLVSREKELVLNKAVSTQKNLVSRTKQLGSKASYKKVNTIQLQSENEKSYFHQKPVIGDRIELPNIYFQRSKPNILQKSFPSLDSLASFMKTYPSMYIEIAGHTDNIGTKPSLLQLSKERAEAVKKYLVYKQRINPMRIETIGYGGARPLNDNSTDHLRSLNRRVEARIVDLDSDITIAKKIHK